MQLSRTVLLTEFFPSDIASGRIEVGNEVNTICVADKALPDFDQHMAEFVATAERFNRSGYPDYLKIVRTFAANGTRYLVAKYHDEVPLETYINQERLTGETEIALFFSMPLSLLSGFHNRGEAYKNLSLKNLLVGFDGRGILAYFDNTHPPIHPDYTPPEQYSADLKNVMPKSYIYAFAALLCRIMAHAEPIESKQRLKLTIRGAKDPYLPLKPGSGYSERLCGAVNKTLLTAPGERLASIFVFKAVMLVAEPQKSQSRRCLIQRVHRQQSPEHYRCDWP